MNIIIEGMSRALGGMESFIMSMYRSLNKGEYQIDFIVYDDTVAFENEILENNSVIYHITPRSINAKKSKHELNMIFRNKKYDVFWSNKTTISNINALRAAYSEGVPIRVIHSHASANMGTLFTYCMHKWNSRQAVKLATNLIGCSKSAAEWMFGKDASKALILFNGIDLKKYIYNFQREKNMREKLGLDKEPVIGHVGRFSKEKNHEFLFRIFAEILKREPNAVLLLCGGGDLKSEFQQLAIQMEIADNVRFLGVRNDIPDVLQVMNVFILPSLFEGYPISLLEAQAAGLSCFASEGVISADVKITDKMYFLSLEKSPEIWAEAIVKVLYEPKKSETDILLEKDISLDKMMGKVEKILNTKE